MTYSYTSGLLSSITDTQGRTINFTYLSMPGFGWVLSTMTDTSTSRTATLNWTTYASGDALTSVVDLDGKTTSFTYDTTGTGNLRSITDPDGHVTAITVTNPMFMLTKTSTVTFGSDSTSPSTYSWAYPSFGTSTLTDANSGVTTYTYNTFDQVSKVVDPNGNNTQTSWSPANKPNSRTDGLSQITSYTYDALQNLTKLTSPVGSGTGRTATLTYPTPNGSLSDYRPATTTDAQGHATSYGYNTTYQVASITTPSGAGGTPVFHYQGDPSISCTNAKPGEVCSSVDGNGNTTTYTYDTVGNAATINAPSPLGIITYGYDVAGRPTSKTDGRGTTTYTTYDKLDRVTKVSSSSSTCPTASCITYVYNAEGWLTQRVDPSGTTSYTYDAQGRPLTKNTPTGNTTYTYDSNGNLATYTDPSGSVGYRYDPANRVTFMWEPGGSCPTTPAYPNATKCTGFTYNAANARTGVNYPNGQTITNVVDTGGREISVTAKNSSGTVLATRAYTYLNGTADSDLRQTMTDGTNTTTDTYDAMNRVLSATIGANVQAWTYDNNGNRLTTVIAGTTTYAAFNAANELCNTSTTPGGTCAVPKPGATTYTYNGAGDLTAATAGLINAATYSTFDQTASTTTASTTTNDTYSDIASDERIASGSISFVNGLLGVTARTVSSVTTSFVRDPFGNLVAMHTAAGSYYYTVDALGSVILMTDPTGAAGTAGAQYTYDTWGTITASTGNLSASNPWQYATGYKDLNGLTKLGTRYLDTTTARFTQQDPANQGSNYYAYAGDNPVSANDPTGRFCVFGHNSSGGCTGASVAHTISKDVISGGVGGAVAGCIGGLIAGAPGCVVAGIAGAAGGEAAGLLQGILDSI